MRASRSAVVASGALGLGCICGPGPSSDASFPDTSAGEPLAETAAVACETTEAPSAELGVGYDAFEPMSTASPVEFGPQGGQHVYLAFRVTGLDLTDWTTLHLTGETATGVVVDQWAQLGFACVDGAGEAVGLQVPVPIVQLPVQFTAELVDPTGLTVTAAAMTTLTY